jgi:hypothetical protein
MNDEYTLGEPQQNQPGDAIPEALRRLQDKLRGSEASYAEFHAWMDQIEPFTASREEMLELIEAVPNDFLGGFLLGIYSFRVMMANVSGRGY